MTMAKRAVAVQRMIVLGGTARYGSRAWGTTASAFQKERGRREEPFLYTRSTGAAATRSSGIVSSRCQWSEFLISVCRSTWPRAHCSR